MNIDFAPLDQIPEVARPFVQDNIKGMIENEVYKEDHSGAIFACHPGMAVTPLSCGSFRHINTADDLDQFVKAGVMEIVSGDTVALVSICPGNFTHTETGVELSGAMIDGWVPGHRFLVAVRFDADADEAEIMEIVNEDSPEDADLWKLAEKFLAANPEVADMIRGNASVA